MKFPLFRRRVRSDTISTLYGTIVAQARLPCFYREYGVPDTVNGRFDLLILHLALVLDRLADEPQLRELGQALFDHFCTDMAVICVKWALAIFQCPDTCIASGKHFMGVRRHTGQVWRMTANRCSWRLWSGISTAKTRPAGLQPHVLRPMCGGRQVS